MQRSSSQQYHQAMRVSSSYDSETADKEAGIFPVALPSEVPSIGSEAQLGLPAADADAGAVPSSAGSSAVDKKQATDGKAAHANHNQNQQQQKLVVHDYHDYSTVAKPADHSIYVTRGGVATLFPLKLYSMLSYVDSHPNASAAAMTCSSAASSAIDDGGCADGCTDISSIVSWQPHGRAFKVHSVPLFKAHILPTFFGKMKYSSFLRQLNLYGFTRLSSGLDKGGYYNELFLQGREFLVYRIQRIKVKGSGTRAAANPDAEPNFYGMRSMCDVRLEECTNVAVGQQGIATSVTLPEVNPSLITIDEAARVSARANNAGSSSNSSVAKTGNKRKKSKSKKTGKNKKTKKHTHKQGSEEEEADVFAPLPLTSALCRRVTSEEGCDGAAVRVERMATTTATASTFGNNQDSASTLDTSFLLSDTESEQELCEMAADLDIDLLQDLLSDDDDDNNEDEDNDEDGPPQPQPAAVVQAPVVAAPQVLQVQARHPGAPPMMMMQMMQPTPTPMMTVAPSSSPSAPSPPQVFPSRPPQLDIDEITFLRSLFAATSTSSSSSTTAEGTSATPAAAAVVSMPSTVIKQPTPGNNKLHVPVRETVNAQAEYRNAQRMMMNEGKGEGDGGARAQQRFRRTVIGRAA